MSADTDEKILEAFKAWVREKECPLYDKWEAENLSPEANDNRL